MHLQYGNEAQVGAGVAAVVKSGVPRADLFIVTKLANDRHAPAQVRKLIACAEPTLMLPCSQCSSSSQSQRGLCRRAAVDAGRRRCGPL